MAVEPVSRSIPVIDLSPDNLDPGTPTWARTRSEVRRAMEETGCFQAVYNTTAAVDVHNAILSAAEELFNLPVQTKSQKLSDKPYFTYFGQHPSFPLYESLAVDHPATPEGSLSFTAAMWPAGNSKFCKSNLEFSEVAVAIDRLVVKMLSESYGVDGGFYDEYVESTNYILRYFRYEAPKEGEDETGLSAHTDKSVVSVLHQNHVGGLQVKAKDGVWIDARFSSPSSFIVMAGDALMAWSNDRIQSCCHRVIMKEKATRYSLGLGSIVKGTLRTPQEMWDDESRPLLYKPFDQFEYLRFYEANPDYKPECPIKAYCGV